MRILDAATLDALSSQAKENYRLRKNLNLYSNYN